MMLPTSATRVPFSVTVGSDAPYNCAPSWLRKQAQGPTPLPTLLGATLGSWGKDRDVVRDGIVQLTRDAARSPRARCSVSVSATAVGSVATTDGHADVSWQSGSVLIGTLSGPVIIASGSHEYATPWNVGIFPFQNELAALREQRAAELRDERRRAREAGQDYAAVLDLGIQLDPGAPMPHLLANGRSAFVLFYLRAANRAGDADTTKP